MGLFDSLGSTGGQSKPPTTTTSGGLFGSAPSSNPSGGLFGNDKPSTSIFAQPVPPLEPKQSIFNQTAPQQQQMPSEGGDSIGDNNGQTAYFNTLLEKNKKRTRDAEKEGYVGGGMPKLELGLGDISRRVRELGGVGGSARADPKADSKAHYLLAASGVNPGSALRDLNTFSPAAGAPAIPQDPEWDPDSHKYVEQLQQQTTLKMIAEGLERAHRNFDAYLEDHVDINWEEQRRKVYEHFGLATRTTDGMPGASYYNAGATGTFGRSAKKSRANGASLANRSVFGASGIQKSVIGTPGKGAGNAQLFSESSEKGNIVPPVQDDRFVLERQGKFARKVQHLNESRLIDKDTYQILREFQSVESDQSGSSPPELTNAYNALIEMVGEGKDGKKVKQRQFRDDYLEDSPHSSKTSAMKKTILDGAKRALETKFYNELKDNIRRRPVEAQVGGNPSTINQIRAYIRLQDATKNLKPEEVDLTRLANGDYCWAIIYYLLRSGFVNEAAQYVKDNKSALTAIDRRFIIYMNSFHISPDRRLSRKEQDSMSNDYQQKLRLSPENTLDPYRMAVYKIVGRCDLSKRSIDSISQTVDDWIWLQFALARESNRMEEVAAEVYGLDNVRETIREIGQKHFTRGSESNKNFGTYFYLQILGGMFESAVAYLYTHSYVSAVHFAIALDYYGLIRVADFNASETEFLTYTTREQPQVNFGRMLGYYTRDFRAGDVAAATDYLSLMYLNADLPGELGRSYAQLTHEALRELILETREFALLLGDIRFDGTRIPGAIENRLPLIGISEHDDFLRTVTLQAAAVADDSGRITDAVLLFHLSDDFDSVIKIINRALSDACAADLGAEPLRIEPVKPRDSAAAQDGQQGSSFSLTTVDDPVIMARNFVGLYNRDAALYSKIRPNNRETCLLLIRIAEARELIEQGAWPEALDVIVGLGLLPLNSNGRIPEIRNIAQNVASHSAEVGRLIGPLLLWTITAIGRQRELMRAGGQFENETREVMSKELVVKARDCMTFAGLVSFRLPKGVWDAITIGASEMGVY